MSGRHLSAALALLVLAGCSVTNPQPSYQTSTTALEGAPLLVVGVERDPQNQPIARALARELAFALAQHGRPALDLAQFLGDARVRGVTMPEPLRTRLSAGIADREVVGWLQAERVATLVFLEVPIFEQVWSARGKRTRVGLSARGRQLDDGEATWRAYATPEVEDEPGQGFQVAAEVALGALVQLILGKPVTPRVEVPRMPNFPLRW